MFYFGLIIDLDDYFIDDQVDVLFENIENISLISQINSVNKISFYAENLGNGIKSAIENVEKLGFKVLDVIVEGED